MGRVQRCHRYCTRVGESFRNLHTHRIPIGICLQYLAVGNKLVPWGSGQSCQLLGLTTQVRILVGLLLSNARFLATVVFVPLSARFTTAFYRRNRPSASGLDPEGEDRTLITHVTALTSPGATWINDRNPKQLPAVARKCDTSQHPATAGETGVVGRGGAADPHGRTERSGVNSSRPGSGRSRGIKFACVHPSGSGRHGQNGEAPGLVPEVLHRLRAGLSLCFSGRPSPSKRPTPW